MLPTETFLSGNTARGVTDCLCGPKDFDIALRILILRSVRCGANAPLVIKILPDDTRAIFRTSL